MKELKKQARRNTNKLVMASLAATMAFGAMVPLSTMGAFAQEPEKIETVADEAAASEVASESEMIVAETEGQGDVIDDEFAVATVEETPSDSEAKLVEEETASEEAPESEVSVPETEGQEDVIDDQTAADSEEKKADQDELPEEDKVEESTEEKQDESNVEISQEDEKESMENLVASADQNTAEKTTKESVPTVDMSWYHNLWGYHGTRVDYENLVPGKFYLMQAPKTSGFPSFKFYVVKYNGTYTNKGALLDDVMVKFDKYDKSGKLIARNKETQVNVNILNLTPNHFYELTDDILVK